MTPYVALLRGVNVGGGNRLPMEGLRATAEHLGFTNVATCLQSGNLLFSSPDDESEIVARLRAALSERHDLTVPVVVRSAAEFLAVVERHPDHAGALPPKLLHVAFLDQAPEVDAVDAFDAEQFAPDRWHLDGRELYLTYPDGSARSKMTIDAFERRWNLIATARNLNTVRRIADLLTASSSRSD
ncbi:MAG: DUF1697 domain-containing protein [Acidimicrobiia bacterium]|nr:DUF1697 domain-containing protein [Acidimicrobiia bacterium]